MTGDVRVLCRPESALGFRLAGLPVATASNPLEAIAGLAELRAGGAGIVLVEDVLHEGLAQRGDLPVLVPFPGPTWREALADEHVLDILRRAIGYRVRLQ